MVSESIPLQTYILTVEATDIDSYENSRLYFYLSGDGHQDFAIDPVTGIYVLNNISNLVFLFFP